MEGVTVEHLQNNQALALYDQSHHSVTVDPFEQNNLDQTISAISQDEVGQAIISTLYKRNTPVFGVEADEDGIFS